MPAPADPDRMLTVSYGPGWRVPDPSFRHLPSREITDRFDGWFSSVMTHRRDWTQYNGQVGAAGMRPSPFARWVVDQVEQDPDAGPAANLRVLDVGSGSSADLRAYDRAGFKAIGYDYAHPGKHALGGKEIDLPGERRAPGAQPPRRARRADRRRPRGPPERARRWSPLARSSRRSRRARATSCGASPRWR